MVVLAAEFEELAASAPPSLPTTEDAAGVAIVVFVEFEEVDAVDASVALPGTSAAVAFDAVEFTSPT